MTHSTQPEVLPFFEPDSSTLSYVVIDPTTQTCAIIDPVLNFDYASGQIAYHSADQIMDEVQKRGLTLRYLIETHVHADHLSAAPYIQQRLGGEIGISEKVCEVQHEFGNLFNESEGFARDGSQFDLLFHDQHTYQLGELNCYAIYTPGHTPACMAHVIGDAVFVGDTLFMPDSGTARTDFPGGDAATLYRSIQKILALPNDTRMFICHDYQPNGRELAFETTVAEQKQLNIHVHAGVLESQFVAMRETRDATLGMPKLIYPSLQTNMRAGYFPAAASNQSVYLRVPVTGLVGTLAERQ